MNLGPIIKIFYTRAGTFLRGVLDKVGVQPELVRIGKFKSAGDQLLRSDMSVRDAALRRRPPHCGADTLERLCA